MLKRTIIVIAVALGVGCKDKRIEQKHLIWHEVDTTEYVNVDSSIRMKVYSHACIYDSCPHIIRDSIVTTGSKVFLPSKKWIDDFQKIGPIETVRKLPSKWTDASKASGRNVMYFEGDTIGGGKRSLTDKYGNKLGVDGSGNIKLIRDHGYFTGTPAFALAVDSLGNIIEDTVKRLPAWEGLDGSSTPSGPIISPTYTVPGGPIILKKKDSLP